MAICNENSSNYYFKIYFKSLQKEYVRLVNYYFYMPKKKKIEKFTDILMEHLFILIKIFIR